MCLRWPAPACSTLNAKSDARPATPSSPDSRWPSNKTSPPTALPRAPSRRPTLEGDVRLTPFSTGPPSRSSTTSGTSSAPASWTASSRRMFDHWPWGEHLPQGALRPATGPLARALRFGVLARKPSEGLLQVACDVVQQAFSIRGGGGGRIVGDSAGASPLSRTPADQTRYLALVE